MYKFHTHDITILASVHALIHTYFSQMSTHTVGHNSPLFSTQWLYIGKWASWLRFSLWGSSRDDRVHKSILCVQKVENYVYPYYVYTYALAEFTLVVLSIILWIPHSPYFTFLAETWRKKRYTVRKQLMICLAHSSRLTCCLLRAIYCGGWTQLTGLYVQCIV